MHKTVHEAFFAAAETYPDREAVIQKNKRATYSLLSRDACFLARRLADLSVKKNDRVALLLDDPLLYITFYFGILSAGGIVVALNTQTSPRTLAYVLNDCGVTTVVAQKKYLGYFEEAMPSLPSTIIFITVDGDENTGKNMPFAFLDFNALIGDDESAGRQSISATGTDPEDIAQIMYTSGTTGRPKGVMLSHANLTANTSSIIEYLHIGPKERHMVVLPFFYSFGNSILLTHLTVGASLVVHQSLMYPKVVLDLMEHEAVTGFSGVPSTYAIMLDKSPIRNYHFPALRYLTQAGGAMPPARVSQLCSMFPHVAVYIMYGQTEASARLSYLDPEKLHAKPGSIGKAIPGVTLKLLKEDGTPAATGETGEIVAQGDNIMVGYWNAPDQTAAVLREDGLHTGDLAVTDDEGYLYIVSRKSDIIKSGAHRIGAKEIEEVIDEHDAVHEAAVVGIGDTLLGEAIRACVVLKEAKACTRKEILAHCRRHLPAFKIPHQVLFVEILPRTASGKVMRNELKTIPVPERDNRG